MVGRHADKHPLRLHPKESQEARGDWVQNTEGYVLKMETGFYKCIARYFVLGLPDLITKV